MEQDKEFKHNPGHMWTPESWSEWRSGKCLQGTDQTPGWIRHQGSGINIKGRTIKLLGTKAGTNIKDFKKGYAGGAWLML